MEQRIGSQKVPPVVGAGFDPAYVPGLTPPNPRPAAEDDSVQDAVTGEEVTQETPADAEPEDAVLPKEPDAVLLEKPDAEPDAASAADGRTDGEDGDDDGPSLEAVDRRGAIVVDRSGVRLRLDDQEAEFRWDEIGAVEYGTARRRLTVTVHTPDRRWYPNDVEAPDKGRLKEWTDRLDAALDAYFEE